MSDQPAEDHPKLKQVGVGLGPEDLARLQAYTARTHRTRSEAIRHLLLISLDQAEALSQ